MPHLIILKHIKLNDAFFNAKSFFCGSHILTIPHTSLDLGEGEAGGGPRSRSIAAGGRGHPAAVTAPG